MKNIIIIIFLFTTFNLAQSEDKIKSAISTNKQKITIKMSAKWAKLNHLVEKEIKTIQEAGRLDAVLKYRLLELFSEKLALSKEKENKVFLQVSPEMRNNRKTESFFKESLALYKKTEEHGLNIIHDHPQFRDIAHIYYTLGINSRDYAKDQKAEKYFLLSQKNLNQRTNSAEVLKHKIKTSLSEYYYNEKMYSLAIKYYKEVLKNKEDSWYSKHLFNSGWCHFKDKKYEEAINLLKEAHFIGKRSLEANDKKYVSLSDQVMNSIGLFFVYHHKVSDGISFYLNESPDAVSDLVKMAKMAAEQGDFPGLKDIVENAYQVATQKKNHDDKIKIRLQELEFYKTFKKDELYFQTAISINQLNKEKEMAEEQKEEAIEKIKEVVGLLQIKLNKDSKKDQLQFKKENLDKIIHYFTILYEIDKKNEDTYRFYQGETYFSVAQFLNSAHAYEKALLFSKKEEGRLDLKSKILHSLLGTLSKDELAHASLKTEVTRLTLFAYIHYIHYWPKNETAQIIYSKLFSLYMEQLNEGEAIKTVEIYRQNFPEDIKIQREQLTRVLDFYIKSKNSDQLSFWANKLSEGYLSFDKDYIEKATEILGNILFEKLQALEKLGKKEEAIKGHIAIYHEEKYPKKIKGRAALNASILYLELGLVPNSYSWQMKSFEHFPKEEIKLQLDKILTISREYALLQDFKHSGLLSLFSLKTFCQDETKQKKDFLKHSISMLLIQDNDFEKVMNHLSSVKKCIPDQKVIEDEVMKIAREIFKRRDVKNLEKSLAHLINHKNIQEVKEMIIDLATQNLWRKKLLNEKFEQELQMIGKYGQADLIKIEEYLAFEQKAAQFSRFNFNQFNDSEVPFSPDLFNPILEKEIATLKSLTDSSKNNIQKASPEILLLTYLNLSESYYHFAINLKNLRPNITDPHFLKSFKEQMSGLAANLEKESLKYFEFGKNKINKDKLVTKINILYSNIIFEQNLKSKEKAVINNKKPQSILESFSFSMPSFTNQLNYLSPAESRLPASISVGPREKK